jgi:hypothetical protein
VLLLSEFQFEYFNPHSADCAQNIEVRVVNVLINSQNLCMEFYVDIIVMSSLSLFSGGLHELSDNYKIGECVRPPCKLKRKTDIILEFKFTPGK